MVMATIQGRAPQVNGYLRKLCRELGAPPAELDADGEVGLQGQFQGREVSITIGYREPEDMIQMLAPLGSPLAESVRVRLAIGFLAANLSPKDTAGLAFGMSPVDGTLVLTCSLLGEDPSYQAFRTAFFRLLGAAAVWSTKLDDMTSELGGGPSGTNREDHHG
jgi:hypothetical protein